MEILLILLILTLAVDLVLTAAKIAFTNSRYGKVETTETSRPLARGRAAGLLKQRSGLAFSLQTSHVILRFLIAGLVVGIYLVLAAEPADVSIPIIFAILLAAALITAELEQVVEARILHSPETWAIRLSGFTQAFLVAFAPLLALPRLAARLLPAQPDRFYRVTEEELNMILDAGEREGVLEVDEREMIKSIFLFRDTTVREVMIPRIDLLALNADTPLLDAIDAMLESGYSRVPVYEESIDSIVGVLYIKDLLRLMRTGKEQASLSESLRPAYFVPETKKVGELLTEMQAQRNHIAIVVDEYGGVAGIATLEDLVEEIVGEIQDEYDAAEEQMVQKVGEDEYVFQAKIDINEVNEILGAALPEEAADTLGGLLYSWFGRIPKTGETTESDDILFTVEQVTGRRIRKVRAVRPAAR